MHGLFQKSSQDAPLVDPTALAKFGKLEVVARLVVEEGDWYELDGPAEKKVTMAPGEVRAVYFPITVRKIGDQALTVRAFGSTMSDAVRRVVEVVPDGKRVEAVINDTLKGQISKTFEIPASAIDGSYKIVCKCYPGIFSQVMEGVDGMLGAPHG